MKKILLPAICTMCITPAFAMDVQPYIGLNLGASYVGWSDEAKKVANDMNIELGEANVTAGLDTGIRFKTSKIWNGAVSVSYDYLFDSEAAESNIYINKVTNGFSMISVGMDNYIRLGHAQKRNDLILGLGVARVTERVKINYVEDTDSGRAAVFKVGFNREFLKYLDWYVASKIFVPFSDKSDTDAIITFTGGFKLHF